MPISPSFPTRGNARVIQGFFKGGRPPLTAGAPVAQPFSNGSAFQVPSTVSFAAHGAGQPLPSAVRQKMEDFFGTSFADVRVHVGPQAASIGALAFTMGSELYFAPGKYDPHSAHGQRLLGHELAHVVQQRAGRVRNPLGNGVAVVQDAALEADAERMAARLSRAEGPGTAQVKNVRNQMRGTVIQRIQDLTDAEWAGVATTLAAELEPAGGGAAIDLGRFHSGGGNHAEDNLIAALPGGAPPGHYQLLIVINRSPCSDLSGSVKANGHRPCMERLIDLQQNGIGGTHTFALQVLYRHLYGHSNNERALNALAVQQGQAAGIAFGHGEGFYDVGVMALVSALES